MKILYTTESIRGNEKVLKATKIGFSKLFEELLKGICGREKNSAI